MSGKRDAARKAAEEICRRGFDVIGIGAGTTVEAFLEELSEREADVMVFTTIPGTIDACRRIGLDVTTLPPEELPIAIDGADVVDPDGNLLKGGGACHSLEKAIDYTADEFWVVVDESKLVDDLWEFPVPVEVLSGCYELTVRALEEFGDVRPRTCDGKYGPVVSDAGNPIVDLHVDGWEPAELERELNSVPGVVECGVFPGDKVDRIIVGRS
ncbi:ribose 5-phosphate isomerase A [Methanopyrus sp.]